MSAAPRRGGVRRFASARRAVTLALLAALGATAAVFGAVACGAGDLASNGLPGGGDGAAGSPDGSGPFPSGDAGGIPVASSGLVVVHAAAFPALRLCFSRFPSLRPQPDSAVMPEANVVGLETGSVVRLDPMDAPGEIYVVDERQVESRAGATGEKTCGELICEAGASCLREERDYTRVGTIDAPLGQSNVDVLAITGCGNTFFLKDVGASSASCGADWNDLAGNVRARVLSLEAKTRPLGKTLPVQLLHLSQLVEAARGTEALDVTFGALDGGGEGRLPVVVASDPALLSLAEGVGLPLDTADDAVFASHGFRVALRGADGGADAGTEAGVSYAVDTTLAEVQALSSPRDLPSDYYRAASNYVLLLLGDPSVPPKLPDGGTNAAFDPRRGVHLLAVPVVAPDAGASAATTGDGGAR